MKRVLTLAVALVATLSASAQYFAAPHGTNPDMVPLTIHQYKEARKEIILPQVRGLNIYKADLHTHSIFSDGSVTPQFRVSEAWQDGLDVIAITEHMEYRGMEQTMIDFLKGYVAEGTKAINTVLMDNPADERGIQTDQNLPIRLAEQAAERYGITVIPGTEI
jgi:hypothetical protein